jgi:hypothetical protein
MNELESAILDFVEKEGRHGSAYITQSFVSKGYPFIDIERSLDNLMGQGRLGIEDGHVVLNFPIGAEWAPVDAARLTNGGFERQLSSQLLNHVSAENRKLPGLAVPDYIKAVMEANEKANLDVVIPSSHKKNAADSASEINMTKVKSALKKLGVCTDQKDQNPAVHSPSHYTRGGIETIDFIEAKGLNFHLGNTVKYVSRAGYKQDALLQDLEKALWYLTREINRLKTQEP